MVQYVRLMCEFRFSSNHNKKKQRKLSLKIYITQHIKIIIIIIKHVLNIKFVLHSLFCTVFEIQHLFYTHSKSQFKWTTFQMFSSSLCFMAAELDGTDLDKSEKV